MQNLFAKYTELMYQGSVLFFELWVYKGQSGRLIALREFSFREWGLINPISENVPVIRRFYGRKVYLWIRKN